MAVFNQDELVKQMAAQAVKQGENLRTAVRELTLQALTSRELTLSQIKHVVSNVTEGINLGAAEKKIDPQKVVSEALAGMDDAVLKAAEASRVALEHFGAGKDFEQSQLKQALTDLEKMEDEFLTSIKQASNGATEQLRNQWARVLKDAKMSGTGTGEQVTETMEAFGKRMQQSMRESRTAGFKMAHLMSQNFATLASGVLIGLSEALQQKGAGKKRGS
jgi:ElaB/YqjD/DUF883 family membrane-anchored ribosome-binding protein